MDRPLKLRKKLYIGGHNDIVVKTKNPETGDPLPVDGWSAEMRLRWEDPPNTHVLTLMSPTNVTILNDTVTFTVKADAIPNTGREGWMEMHVKLIDTMGRPSPQQYRIYAESVYNA